MVFKKLFSSFKKEEEKKQVSDDKESRIVEPIQDTDVEVNLLKNTADSQTQSKQSENLVDAFVELGLMDETEAQVYDEALASYEEELDRETRQWREKTRHTWYGKLRDRLGKTKGKLIRRLEEVLGDRVEITDDVIEDIEEILVEADIGMETTQIIIDRLEEAINEKTIQDMDGVKTLLKTILMEILGDIEGTPLLEGVTDKPAVIIVVGVNGVGKTTTIGKLAAQYRLDGKSVLIAAADTFRAGAIEQVEIWAKKVGVHIVKHSPGSDPAAVVYDSLKAAKARNTDIVIVDTAGRLHTKFNLMEEVKKIHRIIQRELPGAPHEVLQVIDATTGQNGLIQAKKFLESTNVTGIALTKLDGTAKGGIVVAITKELKIPIKLIGIGEGVTDLRPFKGSEFVNALFD
jgi:fused signal recognition particle receptor